MQLLTLTKFDQCVLNMALVNICNQESDVGKEMRKLYNAWKQETAEAVRDPWLDLHQFTIYIPHPNQQFGSMTLEEGITQGYNIEVKPIKDKTKVPYQIPPGGHFVVVLKQQRPDAEVKIAATGIFVRSLAMFSLDLISDMERGEYQSIVVKHPVIRDYPATWEQLFRQFMNGEVRSQELPSLVNHVDQTINSDFRAPAWDEFYLSSTGFLGL